jgi:hypothetical protein
MTIDWTFPRWVLVTLAVVGAAAAYPLLHWGSPAAIQGAVAGAALSTVNVLIGFVTIERNIHRSHTSFMKAVIVGMGLRMAGLLGAMLIFLLALKFHTVAFTTSLLGLYAFFLALEVYYLHTRVDAKNRE